MQENTFNETQALIVRDFELEGVKEEMTEEEFFNYLADYMAYMIERRLDNLLSLMYRLDIDEDKINYALNPANPEPANIELAKLVLNRQKQRIFTKKNIVVQKIEHWEW